VVKTMMMGLGSGGSHPPVSGNKAAENSGAGQPPRATTIEVLEDMAGEGRKKEREDK
jgi:hypothetical protein